MLHLESEVSDETFILTLPQEFAVSESRAPSWAQDSGMSLGA